MPRANGEPQAGQPVAPDEQARVSARLHVPPLQFDDEVLVLLFGPHQPRGNAGGDDDAVTHAKRARSHIDRHPAGQVASVEQRHKALVGIVRPVGSECRQGEQARQVMPLGHRVRWFIAGISMGGRKRENDYSRMMHPFVDLDPSGCSRPLHQKTRTRLEALRPSVSEDGRRIWPWSQSHRDRRGFLPRRQTPPMASTATISANCACCMRHAQVGHVGLRVALGFGDGRHFLRGRPSLNGLHGLKVLHGELRPADPILDIGLALRPCGGRYLADRGQCPRIAGPMRRIG